MLAPSGEYIKTYCEQANRHNFHVWNSHRQHAAWLYQTTPCSFSATTGRLLVGLLLLTFEAFRLQNLRQSECATTKPHLTL